LGIVVRHFEEVSYERTVIRLRLRANDITSEPFSVYVDENAIRQTPYLFLVLIGHSAILYGPLKFTKLFEAGNC